MEIEKKTILNILQQSQVLSNVCYFIPRIHVPSIEKTINISEHTDVNHAYPMAYKLT